MVAAQRALNRATKTLAAMPRIKQQRQNFLQRPQNLVSYFIFTFLSLINDNHFREILLPEPEPAVLVYEKGKKKRTF